MVDLPQPMDCAYTDVLLFNNSVPVWALEYYANNVWTNAEWETWLGEYINTVVGRYKGRIASWDVANEVAPLGGGVLRFRMLPIAIVFYNTLQIWFDTKLIPGSMDFPMLWNNDYQAKPAYYGFRNGLKNKKESWLLGRGTSREYSAGNQTEELLLTSEGSRKVLKGRIRLVERNICLPCSTLYCTCLYRDLRQYCRH